MKKLFALTFLTLLHVACSSSDPGTAANDSDEALRSCNGKASTTIPSSGAFFLTSFGGRGESQKMSCGSSTKSGSWYYAASRQRFGCGAHVRVEARGKCVVVQTDDYGPDACVERAAGRPILDASPLVARALFGDPSAGWSDRLPIQVTKVSRSTPLGPCTATPMPSDPGTDDPATDDPGGGGAPCKSDGDCNPGNDGAGMICTSSQCVPGCHSNAQCPGVTTCVSGTCQ
jgi:hypothetical protein